MNIWVQRGLRPHRLNHGMNWRSLCGSRQKKGVPRSEGGKASLHQCSFHHKESLWGEILFLVANPRQKVFDNGLAYGPGATREAQPASLPAFAGRVLSSFLFQEGECGASHSILSGGVDPDLAPLQVQHLVHQPSLTQVSTCYFMWSLTWVLFEPSSPHLLIGDNNAYFSLLGWCILICPQSPHWRHLCGYVMCQELF